MPRHLIKRYMPDPSLLRTHRRLRHLGAWLHDENLWHLNRRSVAGGVAAGLFWAMIPIPAQMLVAAFSAIAVRINLPISVALVWLTNPITMPAVFYFNYLVGTWLLGTPPGVGEFQPSIEWIAREINSIWKPLYLGSLLIGALLACLGYGAVRLYWRWHVLRRYKMRAARQGATRKG